MRRAALRTLALALVLGMATTGARADYIGLDIATTGGSHTPDPSPSPLTDISGPVTITAEGNDIWGNSDQFRFLYNSSMLTGDLDTSAQVVGIAQPPSGANVWAKAGIMVRPQLTANSANAFVAGTMNNRTVLQRRLTDGAGSQSQHPLAGSNTTPTSNNSEYWVRMTIRDDWVRGMWAPNVPGVAGLDPDGPLGPLADGDDSPGTWTGTAFYQQPMGPYYLGLAATSHSDNNYITASFDHFNEAYVAPAVAGGPSGGFSYTTTTGAGTYSLALATANDANGAFFVAPGATGTEVGNVSVPLYNDAAPQIRFIQVLGDHQAYPALPTFSGLFTANPGSAFRLYDFTPGALPSLVDGNGLVVEPGNTHINLSVSPEETYPVGAYVPDDTLGPQPQLRTNVADWRVGQGVDSFTFLFPNVWELDNVSVPPTDLGLAPSPPFAGNPTDDVHTIFHSEGNEGANSVAYTAAFVMVEVPFFPADPVPNPGTSPGLSMLTVNTQPGVAIGDTATAVNVLDTYRSDVPGHLASGLGSLDTTHFETDGRIANDAAGAYQGIPMYAANRDNKAVRLEGFFYIDPSLDESAPGEDFLVHRTFAAATDDGYRITVGDAVVLERPAGGGIQNPMQKSTVAFGEAGFYPLTIDWWQGGSGAGAEFYSRAGTITDDGDFWALDLIGYPGTDLPVYQALPGTGILQDPATIGGNSGTPVTTSGAATGVPALLGDGLHVWVTGDKGGGDSNNMDLADQQLAGDYAAGTLASDSTKLGSGAVPQPLIDFSDPQNNGGVFGGGVPFPGGTPADDNNFRARAFGLIYVSQAAIDGAQGGNFSLAVGTDDGRRLDVAGTQVISSGYTGANADFAYFKANQPGFYKIDLRQSEGGGGAWLELSQGGLLGANGIPLAIQTSRNPSTLGGFSTNFGGTLYSADPIARLSKIGQFGLGVTALTQVPAAGFPIDSDSWKLEAKTGVTGPTSPGLFAQNYWYDTAPGNVGATTWDESLAPNSTYVVMANPADTFDFSGNFGGRGDDFGVRYTGFLDVPADGLYDFQMNTDDRSWLFIDLDGDGELEAAPGNPAWTVNWTDVNLTAGPHAVEFRAREDGGGQWTNLQWAADGDPLAFLTGAFVSYDPANPTNALWETLAEGTQVVGDLFGGDELFMTFPYTEDPIALRLTTEFMGVLAVDEGMFVFVPEPGSLCLLGAGLAALARRRRRRK